MVSLAALLIPFAIFFLVFAFFAFIDLINIIRWSTTGAGAFFSCIIFIAVVAFILTNTYHAALGIDWSQQIQIIPAFGASTF